MLQNSLNMGGGGGGGGAWGIIYTNIITPRRACATRGQVIALGLVYSVCKKNF